MSISPTLQVPKHRGQGRLADISNNRSIVVVLSARYEKARRGELVVSAPVGFVKAGEMPTTAARKGAPCAPNDDGGPCQSS